MLVAVKELRYNNKEIPLFTTYPKGDNFINLSSSTATHIDAGCISVRCYISVRLRQSAVMPGLYVAETRTHARVPRHQSYPSRSFGSYAHMQSSAWGYTRILQMQRYDESM